MVHFEAADTAGAGYLTRRHQIGRITIWCCPKPEDKLRYTPAMGLVCARIKTLIKLKNNDEVVC